MTKIAGFSNKNESKMLYQNCESARKPLARDSENPIPLPPKEFIADFSHDDDEEEIENSSHDEFRVDELENSQPHLLNQ
ncbi:hypothetical protein L9F63_019702, partial [Diploptera punctata]